MRANSALVRAILPALSTVAIAIGVLWKKRMKRTSAARCGSLPSSRARLSTSVREAPGAPSAPKATLWNSRTGTVLAAAGFQVEVEALGLHVARRGGERGEQRRAFAGDDIRELQPAGTDLRQIVVEPGRQRRIEIDDRRRSASTEKKPAGAWSR